MILVGFVDYLPVETPVKAQHIEATALPGADLDISRMPGHWLMARMGKRVLRPGGLELTREMLDALAITSHDPVVELAPGLGTTMRMVLEKGPASYVAVERDEAAVRAVRRAIPPGRGECRQGVASDTGLESSSANVVFGEAMLTMHTAKQKTAIIQEAYRVLVPGGRYGIHELGLMPDDMPEPEKEAIQKELSDSIHVGARPLTLSEWKHALEHEGFEITSAVTAPMHLLEPGRLIADEGLPGMLRFMFNVLRTPGARRRVRAMRGVFRKYAPHLCGVAIVARKKATA